MIDLRPVKASDPELYEVIVKELRRQQNNVELIASENFVSLPTLTVAGTHLTNKYAEGYPDKRYYGGCVFVDMAEKLAIERAKKLFNVKYVNVQPTLAVVPIFRFTSAFLKMVTPYLVWILLMVATLRMVVR